MRENKDELAEPFLQDLESVTEIEKRAKLWRQNNSLNKKEVQ